MMEENWRPVVGYEGKYEVSNAGVIRSVDMILGCKNGGKRFHKGRVKPQRANNRGYLYVTLCSDGKSVRKLVHRLVAEAFVSNSLAKEQVNHIDGNQKNNNADNLEWVTDNENKAHSSIQNGGTQHPKRKVIAVNIETGDEYRFDGLRDAERYLHLDHGTAMKTIHGKQHQHRGYRLMYMGGDA